MKLELAIERILFAARLGDSGAPVDPVRLRWMVTIHLTFVVSGLLLAGMDWVTSRTLSHSASRG